MTTDRIEAHIRAWNDHQGRSRWRRPLSRFLENHLATCLAAQQDAQVKALREALQHALANCAESHEHAKAGYECSSCDQYKEALAKDVTP